MKKYFFSCILFIAFVVLAGTNAYAQEKIILGTLHYPPYEIENPDDGLHGFDFEVITEAFRRMDVPLEIQFLPWKRALQKTTAGTFAGLFSCSGKRNTFHLSSPISSATDALYVRKGFDIKKYNIRTITDLGKYPNLSVGGVAGYAHMKTLDKIGKKYDTSPDDTTVLKKLFAGRVDVFLTIQEFADHTLSKLGLSHLAEHVTLGQKQYHLCFSKSWPDVERLKASFNKTLKEMKADGSFSAIHAKYK